MSACSSCPLAVTNSSSQHLTCSVCGGLNAQGAPKMTKQPRGDEAHEAQVLGVSCLPEQQILGEPSSKHVFMRASHGCWAAVARASTQLRLTLPPKVGSYATHASLLHRAAKSMRTGSTVELVMNKDGMALPALLQPGGWTNVHHLQVSL
jgi:hypothetical protein